MIEELYRFENQPLSSKTFNDIDDLVKYLKAAKTSPLFEGSSLSSQKTSDSDFNETKSFEEAMDFLEYRIRQAFSRV